MRMITGNALVFGVALTAGIGQAPKAEPEPEPETVKTEAIGPWVLVTPRAAFSPRDSAKGTVFKGKMWLSNGYYHGNVNIRDLWNSADGVLWNQVHSTISLPVLPRDPELQATAGDGRTEAPPAQMGEFELAETPYDMYAEVAAFRDRLWAVKSSVWSSADGIAWTRVLKDPPFRGCSELFVWREKLWALAGSSVWNTDNGEEWNRVAADLPWGGRGAFAFALFDDHLWIMGGTIRKPNDPPEKGYPNNTTLNDVWRSPDGMEWEQVLEKAPWAPRQWVKAAAYDGRLWIFGGYDNVNGANLGDVWHTRDGRTWERFLPDPPWTPRHEPTLFLFDGSLFLVAGNSWPVRNDVWRLTLPQTHTEENLP